VANSDTGLNKVLTEIALTGNLEATSFRRDSDLLRSVLRDVSKLDESMKQLRKINDDARKANKEENSHKPICREYWERGLDCPCIPDDIKRDILNGASPEDLF